MLFRCLLCIALVLGIVCSKLQQCREPAAGSGRKLSEKKFVMITGVGAGIGNYLVFFPAAYYFAVLSGREIVIQDDSIIGEMCKVLHCGFPLFSELAAVFPSVLTKDVYNNAPGAKVAEFDQYIRGDKQNVKVVRAEGYKELSYWYYGIPHALDCIVALTGCGAEDVSCQDRHALQQLIRGPFRSAFSAEEEKKIIGVPANFKRGLLSLPHAFAPRLDAAVHLRCQFKHFEWLVGKEDTMWAQYVQEVDDWLYSKDFNKGQALFQEIEGKIMAELSLILTERRNSERRRRLLVTHYIDSVVDAHRRLEEHRQTTLALRNHSSIESSRHSRALSNADTSHPTTQTNFTQLQVDLAHQNEIYHGAGDNSDRVYVYLAADNERVKEAFAAYLLNHTHISVMRVHTNDIIVHAKNTGYLKQTSGGVMALVVDWYSLSLANIVFAWRRDTDLTSTFARSAQKVSGNADERAHTVFRAKASDDKGPASDAAASPSTDEHSHPSAKMFQLSYKNERARWSQSG